MTLKEITTKKQELVKELRELEEEERRVRDEVNIKKFLGKFVIKKSISFAMHVLEVKENRIWGEGIKKDHRGLIIGKFSSEIPNNLLFVDKGEYLKVILKTVENSFDYLNHTPTKP